LGRSPSRLYVRRPQCALPRLQLVPQPGWPADANWLQEVVRRRRLAALNAVDHLLRGSNRATRRQQLLILQQAADYIMKLRKAEQNLPEWQAAIEALIMAAKNRGPLLHARVGMLRALNRNVERAFNPDRKDTHWGKRNLKRDQ
jgi:hypothetical protein